MSAADNYYNSSLGESSPIWTSEASLARTRERAAKQSRLLSRATRACTFCTISPKWRAGSQTIITVDLFTTKAKRLAKYFRYYSVTLRVFSICFTLTGEKYIVCYTEDIII